MTCYASISFAHRLCLGEGGSSPPPLSIHSLSLTQHRHHPLPRHIHNPLTSTTPTHPSQLHMHNNKPSQTATVTIIDVSFPDPLTRVSSYQIFTVSYCHFCSLKQNDDIHQPTTIIPWFRYRMYIELYYWSTIDNCNISNSIGWPIIYIDDNACAYRFGVTLLC